MSMTASPSLRRLLRSGAASLVFVHRWLGVAACLICVIWFVSGAVMMYAPYPAWTDDERLSTLKEIDASRIAIAPGQAMTLSGVSDVPSLFRLEMWGDEPVYRISRQGTAIVVSAVDGRLFRHVSVDDAAARLSDILNGSQVRLDAEVDRDQWTVTSTFNAHRPLYKFSLTDARGTIFYLSSRTGEIVQQTNRSERFWNWIGSIPHWIYFTSIRADGALWRQVVMWTSAPVIVLSIAGLWLGILRLRIRKRHACARMTPFRGWLKWHQISGLIGGFFLTTWVATGWLSVNPFGFFNTLPPLVGNIASYYGDRPSPLRIPLETFRTRLGIGTKDVSFSWLADDPFIVLNDGRHRTTIGGWDGTPIALGDDQLAHAAQRLLPENHIHLRERLEQEDVYWYSHRIARPLPVLRIGFDDPDSTWVHLDPANGKILSIEDKSQRTYRWIFNLFHDFDLPILLRNRPLWDIVMWTLLSAGLAVALTGTVVSWRAVLRTSRRARKQPPE